jgi:hypothetical protein
MSVRKLTPRKVRNIRDSVKNTAQLAKQYKVSPALIWHIQKRITYREIP